MARLQLGGQPTNPVELIINAGIDARSAPYQAGTRVMNARGVLWNSRLYTTTGTAYLAPVPKPVVVTPPTYSPSIAHTVGLLTCPTGLSRNLIVGRTSGGTVGFWRTTNGAGQTITTGGAAVLTAAMAEYPAVAALWGDLGTPYWFVSHPSMDRVYRIDLGGTSNTDAGTTWHIRRWGATGAAMSAGSIAAWPISGTSEPDGMAALCVHLDRLWGIVRGPSGIGNVRTSRVYYTDPLDSTTIRPTSFVTIPDFGTALARTSLGGIGVGGDAQMVVGCMSSMWVIDGDPTLGTSVRRQLMAGVGVIAQSAMVETDHGVALVGTDGQVYLIRPGAQRVDPIGEDVRGSLHYYRPTLLGGFGDTPVINLGWAPPYLFVWIPTASRYWTCDLSDPQRPQWYGQHQASIANYYWLCPVPAVASPSTGADPAFRFVGTTVVSGDLATLSLDVTPAGGAEGMQTGEITVPGHRVLVRKVILETAPQTGASPITVRVRRQVLQRAGEADNTTKTLTPLQGPFPAKTVFVFPKDLMSHAVDIAITSVGQMRIRRAWVELRTEPAQDQAL